MILGTYIFFWPIPACPYLYKMLYKLDQAENPEIDPYLPKSVKSVVKDGRFFSCGFAYQCRNTRSESTKILTF